jgi:hypothetical protein
MVRASPEYGDGALGEKERAPSLLSDISNKIAKDI